MDSLSDSRAVVRAALIVTGVSLAVRLAWTTLAVVTPVSDYAGYDRLAWEWLQTGTFGLPGRLGLAYRTPGYPAFLAGIYTVFGHSIRAAQLCQGILGGLSSGALVWLAARLVPLPVAALAGLLHACSPTSLVYSAVLATENVSVPLLLLTIAALACQPAAWHLRLTAATGAGAALGLLILVRPAGLFLLPGCACLALLGPHMRRLHWAPLGAFILATGLLLTPWLVRNQTLGLGPVLSSAGGLNLWMGNHEVSTAAGWNGGYSTARAAGFPSEERERDEALRRAAVTWILDHPGPYLGRTAFRAARLLGTTYDNWAARWLTPTAEADNHGQGVKAIEDRNGLILQVLRMVVGPLTAVALLFATLRFRQYALVLLPALSYGAGIAATYVAERFRELWNPLIFVPLAALVYDLCTGSSHLLPRSSRRLRLGLAVMVIGAVSIAHVWARARYAA